MTECAIMLGGNLPGTPEAMEFALRELAKGGFTVSRISRPFHSAAVDCVPGTPDFIDTAVTGSWHKSANDLLKLTQSIEIAAGRPAQHSSRESRILDIDIILFGKEIIQSTELTIPHPRAAVREFVLEPLNEIAPDWSFPDGSSVRETLKKIKNR